MLAVNSLFNQLAEAGQFLPRLVLVLAFLSVTLAVLATVAATMPLEAVESSDGAPRGLLFTRRLGPQIEQFAASHGIARVAGSNNHGWGRTASEWTVLRVQGWRGMSASTHDSAIRTITSSRERYNT